MAWARNGEDVPAIHGGPLRLVAPGYPGSAWQKWIGRIEIRDRVHDGRLMEEYRIDGLPDDRCQCPHWGYVMKGKVTYKFADRDETYAAGDAYYVPAGHTPSLHAGTELIEFSPTEELQQTLDVVTKNMEAAG